LCSWYIELLKPTLNGDDSKKAEAGKRVLCHVIDVSLRLLHPLMPFLTEALWQELPKATSAKQSIMIAPYPTAKDGLTDKAAQSDAERLMAFVSAVRTVRAEYDIAPSMRIPVFAYTDDDALRRIVLSNEEFIKSLAKIDVLTLHAMSDERIKGSAAAMIDSAELAVPLKGIVDFSAESARLNKEKDKLVKLVAQTEKKLANEEFMSRAPQDVIVKEKDKLREASERLSKVAEALYRLQEIEMS
jgi:valyl-tRNA synthetase